MLVDVILNTDCVAGMQSLPNCCIPLTVTSPPYDNLRRYGGHRFDFAAVAQELFRVTKDGGIVVWVVQDQIIDGGESGTSAAQKLEFQRIGFRLHQTLVMGTLGHRVPGTTRYGLPPEYAFVLSKGKPQTINIIQDRANSTAGNPVKVSYRDDDGRVISYRHPTKRVSRFGARGSIWTYKRGWNQTSKDKIAFQHPALMPEKMAEDHINSWSKPSNLVFDPMAGAGTTLKMALLNNRQFLGMEIVPEYYEIAKVRLRLAREQHKRRLDDWLTLERSVS